MTDGISVLACHLCSNRGYSATQIPSLHLPVLPSLNTTTSVHAQIVLFHIKTITLDLYLFIQWSSCDSMADVRLHSRPAEKSVSLSPPGVDLMPVQSMKHKRRAPSVGQHLKLL